MIQNVDLMEAMLHIGRTLRTDTRINDFIYEQFGADKLTIYVGEMIRVQIPTAKETPYIVIYNCRKHEGASVEFARYDCTMAIGVGAGTRPDFVDDEGIKFIDSYDVINKFTQLIIDVINERDDRRRPLAMVDVVNAGVPIDADGGHWAAIIECSWRIYQTMGYSQEEF